jgi:hypothetical protein
METNLKVIHNKHYADKVNNKGNKMKKDLSQMRQSTAY